MATGVLLAIARMTALKVEGVHSMGSAPYWVRGAHTSDGVQVHIEDSQVDLDLYLVLNQDVNLRQVGRDVQDQVARAVSELIGMQPGRIHIHIEDIYYPQPSAAD